MRVGLWVRVACLGALLASVRVSAEPTVDPCAQQTLHTGWQYRLGDTAMSSAGTPHGVMGERKDDASWTPQKFPEWILDETNSDHHLWQRVRLPGVVCSGSVLYLRGAWQIFEIYIGGRRIYSYGTMDAQGRGAFPGRGLHLVPLTPEAAGRWLYMRFYSHDRYRGAYDAALVGPTAAMVAYILHQDLGLLLMGAVYIILGAICVLLAAGRGFERVTLWFGVFTFGMGVYNVCRSQAKFFLYPSPTLWTWLELVALFSIPLNFGLFFQHLWGPGRFRAMTYMWRCSLAYLIGAVTLDLLGVTTLWNLVYAFQLWYLVCCVATIACAIDHALSGNNDARLFVFGCVISILCAIHDVLVSMGLLSNTIVINHYGILVMILDLAVIVGRRYIGMVEQKKNLEIAATVQRLLMPATDRGAAGAVQYATFYRPHGMMEGDWLNVWQTADGETRLIMGDVIGRGPQVALAIAAINAFIMTAKAQNESMGAAILHVNRGLRQLFEGHIVTTLAACCIRVDGTLSLFNCGCPGWVYHGATDEHIPMPSAVLGASEFPVYSQRELKLEGSGVLLGFSDGVIPSQRALDRLMKSLSSANGDTGLDAVIRAALSAGRGPAKDDQSMIALSLAG